MNAMQRHGVNGTIDEARAGAHECRQSLSCLIDGELEPGECRAVLERLRQDEDARERWAIFSCVGDALRSAEVVSWHSASFSRRVSKALEAEPTVLAPAALPRRPALRRWMLPGAGAAAVAAIAVAVGLPSRQSSGPEALAMKAALPTMSVSLEQQKLQIDRSPALERYLAAHRELAEPALMPHSTPYLRTSAAMQVPEGR
jgi:sigma-E factor negative regulatory protein RseA